MMKSAAVLLCALALVMGARSHATDSIKFPPPFANFAQVYGNGAYFAADTSIGFDSTWVYPEDDYTNQTYNYGISADWYRDAVGSPNAGPGNLQPNFFNNNEGGSSHGRWMVTARNMIESPFEDAVNVWTRNWETEIFQGNFYEIRRWVPSRGVEQSPFYGINLEDPDGPTKIRIPFAVWNMGPDPSNTADDYQMVVIVTDANENNIFDFWQIQSKEGSVSDYMTFMAKDEPQPGNADYLEWNLSEDPSDFTNYTEHLADVSLFNWHNYEGSPDGKPFGGPIDAAPASGTRFRIAGGFYPPRCFFRTVTAIPVPQTVYRITAAGGINDIAAGPIEVLGFTPSSYDATFESGDTEGFLTSTYPLELTEEAVRELFETPLQINAGDGYAFCDVGEYLTNHGLHYVGNTAFSTTNEGDIHDSFYAGEGFVYPYRSGGEYIPTVQGGSLWVSNPSSGDVFYGYNQRQHWTATGNMYTSINFGDQDTNSSFEDSYEDDTFRVFQLDVNSRTSTWADSDNDDFAIFWYDVVNSNVNDLVNAQIGMFVDGGIGSTYWNDTVEWDADNEILYTYSLADGQAQRYVGVKCLSHPPTSASSFTEDPTTDAEIVSLMTNAVPTFGPTLGDQKMILSATVSIASFDREQVVFGIVLGQSLAELRTYAQNMVVKYTTVVDSEICFADLNLCMETALPCACIENLMRCTEDAGRACPRPPTRDTLAAICASGNCNDGCCANLFNACEGASREPCFDLAPVPTPTPETNVTQTPVVVNPPVFSSASTLSLSSSVLVALIALMY